MNIKYDQLTLLNKIWRIRGEISTGIYRKDVYYFTSAMKKLIDISRNANNYKSCASLDLTSLEKTFQNMINNVVELEKFYIEGRNADIYFEDDDKLISKIWKVAECFGYVKIKLKNNSLTKTDMNELATCCNKLLIIIHKEKDISSYNKRDLLKICEEIENLILKCEKVLNKVKPQNL